MKILLLIFTVCLISDGGDSKEVRVYSGGGVLIKCKYNTEYTQNLKYFCKGSSPDCSYLIKMEDKNTSVTSGRFSLFDDTKSAEFRVMIRELTVEDTGTYQCGVDKSSRNNIHTPVKLNVKEGILGSREVSAYAGGGINIKCRYEDEYKDKPKSFCKIGTHQWRFTQITTKPNSDWTHEDRFSIYNNRSAGFLRVFIRELITEDTGTYACVVSVSDEVETFTAVKLNVTEDQSYEKSITETVHVGGDLKISCKYPQSLRNDTKFLCRRQQTAVCSIKGNDQEINYVNERKFPQNDDKVKQIFTVSIRNVSKRDSGEYWCGAKADWTSNHGYRVYFTQINLTVTETPLKPTQASVPSSSSSSSSSSTTTTTLAPAGFRLSIVDTVFINVMIGLVVGNTCLCLAYLIKHMIKGRKATPNKNSVPGSANSHKVNVTRSILAPEAGTSAGGSTSHDLFTSPSDPSQAIYANTMLPLCPHDSATASTTQLTTIYPDSANAGVGQTAENLNYATVHFHNNDAADKIRFQKEEETCEYSTVRHD